MQNYFTDLVWRADWILSAVLCLIVISLISHLFFQDFLVVLRKRRLSNIKKIIYELLISGAGSATCHPQIQKLNVREFLDIATNRSRQAAFFNEAEQEYFKNCFVNQENILKIERIARKSRNKWRRIEAIMALGYAEAASALPIFEKGIFDKDADIAYFSLLSLGRIKTDLSARILTALLKNNSVLRKKVISILETFPSSATDEILKLTDNHDPVVRFWALKILSRFKPVKYNEKVMRLSRDKDANVRAASCECLGSMGIKEAEDALLVCLKDDFWLVRSYAAKALFKLAGANSLSHIAGLLSDNSLNVVATAKNILMQDIDASLRFLIKTIAGQDPVAAKMSVEILTTTGYTQKLMREMLVKDLPLDSPQIQILISLIDSGAHYGIEFALEGMDKREQQIVLNRIKNINPQFAGRIIDKLEGRVREI